MPSVLSVIFAGSRLLWHKCQWVFSYCCTSIGHVGRFDCLMSNLILIKMDNGRGYCTWLLVLSATPSSQPIGLLPGAWQTSFGMCNNSQYSTQNLIRITTQAPYFVHQQRQFNAKQITEKEFCDMGAAKCLCTHVGVILLLIVITLHQQPGK